LNLAKKKRALSKYNLFVKRQVLAGKTFAQAASAWRGGKTVTLKTRKSAVKRKVKHMARRRGRIRSAVRRYRGAGGMTLTKGLFPVPRLLASALLGAGVAAVQRRFLPQMIPYQGAAAGFVVGGVAGAAGAFASEMLLVNGNRITAVNTAGGW
jgi:hypothetical protein